MARVSVVKEPDRPADEEQYWDEDAEKLNKMCDLARQMGVQAHVPSKKEVKSTYNTNDFFAECDRDEGGHCIAGGDASRIEGKTPVERIKNAVKLVSTYGRDASGDRELADAIVEEVSDQPKATLFQTLKDAGIEGARPSDSKVAMMRRLHTRLTAAIRAKERSEV